MTDKNNSRLSVKEFLICFAIGMVIGLIITVLSLVYLQKKCSKVSEEPVVIVNQTSQTLVEYDKVSVEYINRKLKKVGKLLTAEMNYSAICSIEDGKIPFITKKGFSMMYTAQIQAGLDIKDIDITVENNVVRVEIPKASISMVHVAPESIAFFDTKQALFNWNRKEDVVAAIEIAEESARRSADLDGLRKEADENSQQLIKALLEDAIGKRVLVVSYK